MVPMPLALTNCHTSCVSLPPLHETVMYVVVAKFCKLQYIIASWIEFPGTLDKLDVKGLELKKEQEDDKRGKNDIQRTVMRLMTNETVAQMSSVIIQNTDESDSNALHGKKLSYIIPRVR